MASWDCAQRRSTSGVCSGSGETGGGDDDQPSCPETLHGDPAEPWRALERRLRSLGAGTVADLGATEQLRWARRTKALSAVFAVPTATRPVPIGDEADTT